MLDAGGTFEGALLLTGGQDADAKLKVRVMLPVQRNALASDAGMLGDELEESW